LAAVAVAAVDHQARAELGLLQGGHRAADRLGVVVGGAVGAAQDEVTVRVAARGDDGREPLLGHRQEMVGVAGGLDGVDGDLRVAVGAVLEPDRDRQPGGQLAVHLALGGPRPDGAPADQVGDVLGRDGVQELAAGGQAHLGQVQQQAARDREPLVHLERAVQVRVVDEPLPPDGGAGLFEVDAHHDDQRVRQLGGHGLQAARVLAGGGDVVDGTGADDHQQPVVLAAQDARRRVAPLGHRGRGPLGEREVLHQDLRWDQRADAFDAKVVRGAQHAGRRNLACFCPPCARPTAKGRGMMAMMRRGLDGFSDDVRGWRAATADRAPVYHRLLEEAVALFQAPVGSTEEAARARVEAAWRERKQASPYARPLLLMAALRAEGLRAGPRYPLFEAIAAPKPQVTAATRERLAAALGDASPRLFADLATRTVQTNETSRAVAWRWPA